MGRENTGSHTGSSVYNSGCSVIGDFVQGLLERMHQNLTDPSGNNVEGGIGNEQTRGNDSEDSYKKKNYFTLYEWTKKKCETQFHS